MPLVETSESGLLPGIMNIGSLLLHGRTVLAPLAGITNLPFRKMVKSQGCALVCSEMISAKGLFYNSEKTLMLLDTMPDERPLSVQIFGSEPESMAEAARMIEKRGCADIIDINFGCSVKKVVKTGAGAALMKDIRLSEKIIQAVRGATNLPFTIKIRTGWDSSGHQAFEIARMAETNGVDAVVFHPRSALQGFRGRADWSLIKNLKEHISIPVLGNGDIVSPQDGVRMIHETGCDAVMVGRAAMGNPFILSQIDHLLIGTPEQAFSREDVFRMMETLIAGYVDYFGGRKACRMLRSRLVWFVRGWPECSRFRRDMTLIQTHEDALYLIHTYEQTLQQKGFL